MSEQEQLEQQGKEKVKRVSIEVATPKRTKEIIAKYGFSFKKA